MIRARVLLTSLLALAALAAVPASASADFGFLGDWGTTGDQNGQFHTPTYIDTAPDGSVWVAENDKRVQKFTADGQYVTQVQVGQFAPALSRSTARAISTSATATRTRS